MVTAASPVSPKIRVDELCLVYGEKRVLNGVSFEVEENEIFAIIGPAQSGKSSLLRCLNRTIEFVPGAKMTGSIAIDGTDVSAPTAS